MYLINFTETLYVHSLKYVSSERKEPSAHNHRALTYVVIAIQQTRTVAHMV